MKGTLATNQSYSQIAKLFPNPTNGNITILLKADPSGNYNYTQRSKDLSKLSLDNQCPVIITKCGRTSKNSCRANEGKALRALALGRAAVQATKFSTFTESYKPEMSPIWIL